MNPWQLPGVACRISVEKKTHSYLRQVPGVWWLCLLGCGESVPGSRVFLIVKCGLLIFYWWLPELLVLEYWWTRYFHQRKLVLHQCWCFFLWGCLLILCCLWQRRSSYLCISANILQNILTICRWKCHRQILWAWWGHQVYGFL